jgi:hypothetical protein
MSTTAAGISVTTISAAKLAPLGFELAVPTPDGGEDVYIYVFNDSGGPLVVGQMQTRKAGTATYHVAQAGAINPAQAVGLCTTAIPNNNYGFLLRKGHGVAVAGGAVTANLGLILGAAGVVTHAAAVTGSACGNTLAGVGGAGAITVFLNCQG